ncbi:F-box/WD repeat-containing protein 8 isoform X2 [Ambystoma mexicanum]|uniref:F-box/WD repeat-containing protein 8 isoform X2 n=1 Tax=Ambystoma mexicanum TaxID=8296 RepID=UPI0037E98622
MLGPGTHHSFPIRSLRSNALSRLVTFRLTPTGPLLGYASLTECCVNLKHLSAVQVRRGRWIQAAQFLANSEGMSRESPLREFRRSWREELERRRRELRAGPHGRRDRPGAGSKGHRREEKSKAEPVREWSSLPGCPTPGGPPVPSCSTRGVPVRTPLEASRRQEEPGPPGYLELAESLLEVTRRCCRPEPPRDPKTHIIERGGGLVEQLISDLNEINEVPFFDVQLPYELALQIFQNLGRTELGRCAQNRIGAVKQLQYELGKVLSDVYCSDGVVIAGYTSGDVRLWDTRTWDYTAPILEPTRDAVESGQQPHVSFVRINSSLAVAAYEDGTIDVWSLMIGREPVHHYQHNQKIQALALSSECVAIATASGFQIKLESPDDRGYWRTLAQFSIPKLVNFLHLVPETGDTAIGVAAADEVVYLLKNGEPIQILHSVYGHPVTCLDVSSNMVAFGVKSYGWMMNEGNKIHLYSLQTGQNLTTLGNSAGDFSCINMKDSPPHMLVTGNKDRRIRVYDIRSNKSLCSLYAHQLGVSAARMDDWKIVSGGEEGLVCVWDQRMGTKLWETHARHPVRHIWFNAHSLITANIPVEKSPRGACITDDDLTAHRRHRGIIYSYHFSVDHLARESILPICRSSYDEAIGYNYNIGLAVPYDNV